MQKYAKVAADGRFEQVLETDASPGEGWQQIPQSFAWTDRPNPRLHPFLVAGAVQWLDGRTVEQAWAEVRARRHALLLASDWVSVRAYELQQPLPEAWAAYRQALRDITEQPDPFSIEWPAAPA